MTVEEKNKIFRYLADNYLPDATDAMGATVIVYKNGTHEITELGDSDRLPLHQRLAIKGMGGKVLGTIKCRRKRNNRGIQSVQVSAQGYTETLTLNAFSECYCLLHVTNKELERSPERGKWPTQNESN